MWFAIPHICAPCAVFLILAPHPNNIYPHTIGMFPCAPLRSPEISCSLPPRLSRRENQMRLSRRNPPEPQYRGNVVDEKDARVGTSHVKFHPNGLVAALGGGAGSESITHSLVFRSLSCHLEVTSQNQNIRCLQEGNR